MAANIQQEVFSNPQNGSEYTIVHFKYINDKPISSDQYFQIYEMLNDCFNRVVKNNNQ